MSDDFDPNEFLNAALGDEPGGGADRRSDRPPGGGRDPFEVARRSAAAKAALSDGKTTKALMQAARQRSPEARNLLVQGLNELCLKSGTRLSDTEKQLVFDIFGELIGAVETHVRASVSGELAEHGDAPHDLVLTLARDAIEVAEPILTRSLVLADDDLTEIVRAQPESHQLAVTRRARLTGTVTEAIANTGSETVVAAMLENENAEVDEEVMLRIAADALDRPALHGPLSQRKDLPMRAARQLYSVVGDALKETIEQRMREAEARGDAAAGRAAAGAKEAVDDALHQAMSAADARQRAAEEEAAASSDPGPDPDDLMQLSVESGLGFGDRPHPRLLVKALVAGDYEEFETLFGEFAGLDSGGVDRILNRAGPEALAIACKAGGMGKQDFGEVLARVMDQDNPSEAARTDSFRKTITYFDRIDASGAGRVLQAWR